LYKGLEHPFSPHIRSFTRRSLRTTLETMGFHIFELHSGHATLFAVVVR
jgi:hypothetical protein